jgi:hypothetical protein
MKDKRRRNKNLFLYTFFPDAHTHTHRCYSTQLFYNAERYSFFFDIYDVIISLLIYSLYSLASFFPNQSLVVVGDWKFPSDVIFLTGEHNGTILLQEKEEEEDC